MEIKEHSVAMKNIYNLIIDFLESEDENEDENFVNLVNNIKNQNIFENSDKIHEILIIINKISKNHCRQHNLIQRTETILEYYKDQIKQTFSNFQIFDFFKHNKRVLLFLIQQNIVDIDDEILHDFILNEKYVDYQFYFFNEIKEKISNDLKQSIEEKMNSNSYASIEDDKLTIGENDDYLCSLIRNDSIDDFIINFNKKNISPNCQIVHSIYETNYFLIKKEKISMIEYASFFGSMQIIRYLYMNKADLDSSLWIYGIHSNNPELIHFLEENKVIPEDKTYSECYNESIKCHHNNIAHYIYDNLLSIPSKKSSFLSKQQKRLNSIYKKNSIIAPFCYHNYNLMQTVFDEEKYSINDLSLFFYFCEFDYIEFVKFYVKENIVDINQTNEYIYPYDQEPESALHIAGRRNNIEIVDFFMEQKMFELCKEAFNECDKLREIKIPLNTTSIRSSSFKGCSSLKKIEIPSSVTSIGYKSFYGCSSLKEIIIPSSVTSIGFGSFSQCKSLKEIKIPSSVTKIESGTFEDCKELISIEIPSSVTLIGSNSFKGCSSLKEIKIPSSVTKIERYAFKDCKELISIEIPSSVITIGDHCFENCHKLTHINLASLISTIFENTFEGCSSLVELSLPSSVTLIEFSAFKDCQSLKHISIPDSVTLIKECAFKGCHSLEKVSLPSSLTQISERTFEDCSSLVEVTNLTSINSIKNSAFIGCNELKNITFSSSLISIDSFAFFQSKIREISIPSSVKSIGTYAFSSCQDLIKIEINAQITEIKANTFVNCVKLADISLPSSVKLIGTGSFDNCSSLVEINLPSSLEKIEKQAFRRCWSLKKISIPSSVNCIEKMAFKGCTALENVEIHSRIVFDKSNENAFDGCTSLNQVMVHFSHQIYYCKIPKKVKIIEFTK